MTTPMTRNVLKATAVALAASVALIAPAPSAEAHGWKRTYTYGYSYRPAYVYRAPTCVKYAWVWKHHKKHLVCVHAW